MAFNIWIKEMFDSPDNKKIASSNAVLPILFAPRIKFTRPSEDKVKSRNPRKFFIDRE
jgi:hypothetical protein